MTPKVGQLYVVNLNGKKLANLYRFMGEEKQYCQLHGDLRGTAWKLQKRRNSDKRLWGSIRLYDPDSVSLDAVICELCGIELGNGWCSKCCRNSSGSETST